MRSPPAAALRFLAFLAWSAAVAAAWLLSAPFLGAPGRVARAGRLTQAYGRGMLRVLGIRLRVSGPVPPAPFFLACNHLGYLDVAVLSAAAPSAFVAKAEVAAWPLFGALAAWSGTLFIDRNSRADVARINTLIARRWAAGGSLVIFPEGTSTDGTRVLPFHSSLLHGPASSLAPVHYAALRYRATAGAAPAERSMCWWGDMEFLPHFLGLFRLQGLEADLAFGPQPLRHRDRKALAAALQAGVVGLLRRLEFGPPRPADRGSNPFFHTADGPGTVPVADETIETAHVAGSAGGPGATEARA